MYCKNCGAQIIDGSKFCRNCGQEIEAPRVAKPIYTTKEPPIPKKKTIPKKLPTTTTKKKHGLGKFLKFVIFSLLSIPILVLIILLVVSISKDVRAKSDTAKNLAEIDPGKSIEKLIENTEEDSLLADNVVITLESLNGYIVDKEIVTAFIGGMIWEI